MHLILCTRVEQVYFCDSQEILGGSIYVVLGV